MSLTTPDGPSLELPPGWEARGPREDDVAQLVALVRASRQSVRPDSGANEATVRHEVTGRASWTRRQLVVQDADGALHGWATVHDRAAGRTNVEVTVDPSLPREQGDDLAVELLRWIDETSLTVAAHRGLAGTRLDITPVEQDTRLIGWLEASGYHLARTWLQMTRPVDAEETFPAHRPGVEVRQVRTHENGSPLAEDLQAVHLVLEESFADHFNSYRESFPEFVLRQREASGHAWDHWWLATVPSPDGEDEAPLLAGAVVSSTVSASGSGREGSYIDYIGVHRNARGHGVAKALLHTVLADARDRGRDRVGLEVDDDSPTGADGLYTSMGWHTSYRTQSWHKDLEAEDPDPSLEVPLPKDDDL